ncbi:MAG: ribosome recycling factor [Candidatus Pacebacteria bacterium]|nr:ribosome recycling factor [Candidatus Paceibacterota bacterium]MCF7857159.1 ribosome recycling factor [Candidatus Paceibacterota bacterium]
MPHAVKNFEERGTEVVSWLEREFSSIRTGRATPMLLDLVLIESYGARVPIQQVGSVSVEDARTLRISVWDQAVIKEVERAITDADLGVSVAADGAGVRVIFPELTSERRIQLLKIAKSKLEESRVSLRGARDEAVKEIDSLEKSGEISQDTKFSTKEDLQKRVDTFNLTLEKHFDLKEKEINQ